MIYTEMVIFAFIVVWYFKHLLLFWKQDFKSLGKMCGVKVYSLVKYPRKIEGNQLSDNAI